MTKFAFTLAAAASLIALAPAPAAAEGVAVVVAEGAAALTPGRYVWQDDATLGPVSVVISIPDQRAYVYRGTTLVAASAVSTGREGNETPTGAFTILQKEAVHHSNLYDSAPMPFMQRLTWDGVALHAGRNPGYADSHGCVRLPATFAKKLFAATELGATVVVTDESVDAASYGSEIPQLAAEDVEATAEANRVSAKIAANFDKN